MKLETQKNGYLEVTSQHLVYVQRAKSPEFIMAKHIKVGDQILKVQFEKKESMMKMNWCEIISIKLIKDKTEGIYAPLS